MQSLADKARSALVYSEAVVRSLLREEARERRPKRLLEPSRATWTQFRGRLNDSALIEILLEDAAVAQPLPFDPSRVFPSDRPLQRVPADRIRAFIDAPPAQGSSSEFIASQAKLLGLPTRIARSDLPVVKPHQRVLELPGSGGQLAHHLLETHPDLPIREVFTIACGTWQELVLGGIVCVENGLQGNPPVILDPKLESIRLQTKGFDFVLGIDAGLFSSSQLASWFPTARVVLV